MKERKQKINGEIVKIRKPSSKKVVSKTIYAAPNNAITWMKQTNVITKMSMDYSLLQLKIFILVIEKIQKEIEMIIGGVKTIDELPLFNIEDKRINLNLALKDLKIKPYQYPEVREALKQMASIPVEMEVLNDKGNKMLYITNLMSALVPEKGKTFSILIEKNVAEKMLSCDFGFTRYIKEIAFNAKSKYTTRIYMLISSWRHKGGFQILLKDFRKWLKLEDKYSNYRDLYRFVIRPAHDELYKDSNCWFEVIEKFKEGENDPYVLQFKIIEIPVSKDEIKIIESQRKVIKDLCYNHFDIKENEIKDLLASVTLGNCSMMVQHILNITDTFKKNENNIKNKKEYFFSIISKILNEDGNMGRENNIVDSDYLDFNEPCTQ